MTKSVWYLYPYAGGPGLGRFARPFYLASGWIASGVKATVFCSSWHHLMTSAERRGDIEIIGGVPYCFVPTRRYQGNGLGRLLNMADFCIGLVRHRRKYRESLGKPDVIVASSPHPYSVLAAYLLAKVWKCKLVFEVRDLWPLSLVEIAGVPKYHPLALLTGWVERLAYRRADATVSLLPGAKDYMVTRGLAPEKFFHVPNGVWFGAPAESPTGTSIAVPPVIELARRLRNQGGFVVIYPGAMGPPNNMKPLVHAARLISEAGVKSIHFILMGEGGELAELKEMVTVAGQANVHFFPQADRSVALELMSYASAGYVSVRRLPIYRHGISFNKLFEYMQHGLPVIFAAEVSENPVTLSGCGVVTSPDEPENIAKDIIKFAQSPLSKRAAQGRAGAMYVTQFHDYRLLADQYLSILDGIVPSC